MRDKSLPWAEWGLGHLALSVVCFLAIDGAACTTNQPGLDIPDGVDGGVPLMPGSAVNHRGKRAEDSVTPSGTPKFLTQGDTHVTYVLQKAGLGGMQYGLDDSLRANGVYLRPAERVAIGVVDEHPFYPAGTRRRIQIHIADVGRFSPTKGQIVNNFPLAYQDGTESLLGLSSSSFYDANGNVDGLFAAIDDANPPRIMLVEVQGENSTVAPVVTQLAGLPSSYVVPGARPALEFGQMSGAGKMLLAYGFNWYGYQYIDVGFISRNTSGTWSFQHTQYIYASGANGPCTYPVPFNVTAAYDATNGEFGVGWYCVNGTWSATFARVDWNGHLLDSPSFSAHVGLGALHSGLELSYNMVRNEYLFTFQHNAAVITRGASGLSCVRKPGSTTTCVDPIAGCESHGSAYASEVDYWGGFSFRMGSQCISSGDVACVTGEGVSAELVAGRLGNSCQTGDWVPESGALWPIRPSGESSTVHAYVRAPGASTAVALHVWERPGTSYGLLRMSFVDEPTSHLFYQ